MTKKDEVDLLLDQLKALPLIDGADLDAPFAAFDAFELVLSAITRAALVQVPQNQRRGNNGALFQRFVVERFPSKRGRGDATYAKQLWEFRCDFVKGKRTGRHFVLTHNRPEFHLQLATNAAVVVDLHGLIADFRLAVDDLGRDLHSDPAMRQVALDELRSRRVELVQVSLPRSRLGANAASGTN